tara:strand:+ start:12359 stop:14959 length:2601 start_codon:yes stop_codon:yes gene_type:complete
MRAQLIMAVLLFSMLPAYEAQSGSGTSDGATMDVILVGDRVIDSVGSEVEIGIQESYPNSTTQIISGDNLGLDDHLRFYEDGLTPWSIAFEEQSDFLILQPKSIDIAVQPESSGHGSILTTLEKLAEIADGMPADPVLFMPWAHKNGDSDRPITMGDFLTMDSLIMNATISLLDNVSSGLGYVIPAGAAFKIVYMDDLALGINPLDQTSNFSSLYSNEVEASEIGAYLIACTLLISLFNDDCSPNLRPNSMDVNTSIYLIEVARRAVEDLPDSLSTPYEDNRAPVRFRNLAGGTYTIQPGSSIGVTLFVRNFAEENRVAVVNLTESSGWNWSWEDDPLALGARLITLESDREVALKFLIHAPLSHPGGPIAGSTHHFEASVMDQFGFKDNWDFRLETGRQRSIQITSGGGSISMPPNSIAVLDIELRNTGNSVDDIRVELFSNNDGVEQIGSLISIDGWGVILLDDSLAAGVDPWSTGRIRMQISTPSDSTGSLDFGIRAGPAGLPHQDFSFTSIVISTRISGSFSVDGGDCENIEPGEDCILDLLVSNDGMGSTVYSIEYHGVPEWIEIELPSEIELDSGESTTIPLHLAVDGEAQLGVTPAIEIRLRTQGLVIDSEKISFTVSSEAVLETKGEVECAVLSDDRIMLSVFVVNTGRRVDYVEAVVDIDKDIDHGFLINGSYTHDRFLRFDPIGYQEALEIQAWSSPSQDSTRLSMTATPVGNPGSSVESTCTFNQVISSSDDEGDYDFLWVFQGFLIMASLGVCACGLLLFNSSLRKRKISDAYTGDPDTISAEVFAEGFKRSRSELRSYDSEEIARSNRALDSGLLDSVIQDIEELPNSLRHESKADTKRSEKELDDILKDLID